MKKRTSLPALFSVLPSGRAFADNHFGESKCIRLGDSNGFTALVMRGVRTASALCIEDIHRLPRSALPGEFEEDLLESAPASCFRAQILNRTDRADLPVLDDG